VPFADVFGLLFDQINEDLIADLDEEGLNFLEYSRARSHTDQSEHGLSV
jgi:hypothetical protein